MHGVETSSMGRWFDGVAAILGIRQAITYEGQAAMELETRAAAALVEHRQKARGDDAPGHGERSLDLADVLNELVLGLRSGRRVESLALVFHLRVARWISHVAAWTQREWGVARVGLTGGVFQNVLLANLVADACTARGFQVLMHRAVPCNDGGLALGQAWLSRHP